MRTLARGSVLLIVCASSFGVMAAPLDDAARARVYATLGETLTQYDADLSNATLTPRGTVLLPGYVQEAWRHPTKPVLYVAWSNGGPLYAVPGGAAPPAATRSGITSVAIDPT